MAKDNNTKDPETEIDNKSTTETEPAGNKKSLKKIIIIASVALLLLILIGVGLYFSGIFGNKKNKDKSLANTADTLKANANKVVYLNLDEFIVNLTKSGGQRSFLKLALTLEIPNQENLDKVGQKMPLIRDTFQIYLRELRAEDLQGSAGIYRLRQALLLRINKLVYPVKISDILFREILVQ